MASKFQMLQKATQISQFVAKNGVSYYKELMEKNKQYIQQPSNVETCQLLANQLFYTRLASIPRRYEAFWKKIDSLKDFLKTKEAWSMENPSLAALFGVECFGWSWGGDNWEKLYIYRLLCLKTEKKNLQFKQLHSNSLIFESVDEPVIS